MNAQAKEPAGELQHTEMLFDEINKLVKTQGLKKAIIHLQSMNNSTVNFSSISTYELIIKTVLDVFRVSEQQLFKKGGKITIPDARRTAFYLLDKYLKIDHKSIAIQFGKGRTTVTMGITRLSEMTLDRKFYKDYMDKHDEAERRVIEYIENLNKKKQREIKNKN